MYFNYISSLIPVQLSCIKMSQHVTVYKLTSVDLIEVCWKGLYSLQFKWNLILKMKKTTTNTSEIFP